MYVCVFELFLSKYAVLQLITFMVIYPDTNNYNFNLWIFSSFDVSEKKLNLLELLVSQPQATQQILSN